MKITLFGGTFDPPHAGHIEACRFISETINPDLIIVLPNYRPHYKKIPADSPSEAQRYELCKAAFGNIQNTFVCSPASEYSDYRYTADIIRHIKCEYPGCELFLALGSDQFYGIEKWFDFSYIIKSSVLLVFSRDNDRESLNSQNINFICKYNASTVIAERKMPECGSYSVRNSLCQRDKTVFLTDDIYSLIIRGRYYNSKPDIEWLIKKALLFMPVKREHHVRGCITTASKLAEIYSYDSGKAMEAAALHDISKGFNFFEHIRLINQTKCKFDTEMLEFPQILHAFSGAELSLKLFGIDSDVYNAIRWHTTGRPKMSLLEKIIYISDIIEPNRDFQGVGLLRQLAFTDIDSAVTAALKLSIEHIRSKGEKPYSVTCEAYEWYNKKGELNA